jgi:phage FluMu gp28-like protein
MSDFEAFKKQLGDATAFTRPPVVISRDPDELPEELPRGAEIPEDLDPLAEGVLMKHQVDWIADTSPLKIGEKGRRTGITFAEAIDDTLVAAAARSAGGSNVFYIGDTKDKGREFIGYVAHAARTVAKELVSIEEFVFTDQRKDGSSVDIAAYRITFASGFRVEALSSRPENIRGLQGIVVIDEAAFHKDVGLVLDAVNALLIWGGKIRIISTHNGVLNPFNQLIRQVKATGKPPYALHFIPFSKAVENGLYERTCLIAGKTPTPEGKAEWEALIRGAYGVRTAAMKQELDCVPAEADGAALTRVGIESCMALPGQVPIVRLALDDGFRNLPEATRRAMTEEFCETKLVPILERLDKDRPHYYGADFARSGDASVLMLGRTERTLTRSVVLQVELRNVPFETQRDVHFYILDRTPRFSGGADDANGNGAYLAEVKRQKYGERVLEVKATAEWYRLNSVPYVEAFSDQTILLPRDEDVLRDHQALAYVNGVIRVPDDVRFEGEDGLMRHGDSAIAGILFWFATMQAPMAYGYRGAPPVSQSIEGTRAGGFMYPDDGASGGDRDWWAGPRGARLRGSV